MAVPDWTAAALSATETTAFNADKPILGANVIPATPTVERWNDAGTIADASRTATGYPAARVHDDSPDYESKPDAALTPWCFVWDFGTSGIPAFDFLAIIGHNFNTVSVTTAVFQLDNTAPKTGTFASTVTLCTFTAPTSNDRLISLDLHHTGAVPLRYTDARYARLVVNMSAGAVPEIRELIIGRRRQMSCAPDLGFDPSALENTEEIGTTKGNSVDKTTFAKNAFRLDAMWTLATAAEHADIVAWHKQAPASFVWIEKPYSLPNSWHLMMREGKLSIPYRQGLARDFSLSAQEIGPEGWHLANE